jgi:hypothetical protein
MDDDLRGVDDIAPDGVELSRPIGRNAAAANKRMTTGSQVTFSQNMETTHNFNPAESVTGEDISESESDDSSAKQPSSSDDSEK